MPPQEPLPSTGAMPYAARMPQLALCPHRPHNDEVYGSIPPFSFGPCDCVSELDYFPTDPEMGGRELEG